MVPIVLLEIYLNFTIWSWQQAYEVGTVIILLIQMTVAVSLTVVKLCETVA